MIKILVSVALAMISTATWAVAKEGTTNNDQLKLCLEASGYEPKNFDTFDFSTAAACFHQKLSKKQAEEMAELRDFLKHNPRYRYPGQSNNRCFGKPREMPFESAYIEKTGNGFRAGVTYKDKLPANCFETAPWDNRDVEN